MNTLRGKPEPVNKYLCWFSARSLGDDGSNLGFIFSNFLLMTLVYNNNTNLDSDGLGIFWSLLHLEWSAWIHPCKYGYGQSLKNRMLVITNLNFFEK